MKLGASIAFACFAVGTASADTTPQMLPFTQDWTNTALISTDDDWSGVPGIVGYKDDLAGTTTGVDPQTLLAPQTVVDVIANQTNGNLTSGGVAEMQLADPVVGLNGSGTADAPNIVIAVNTTGVAQVRVRYLVRDLDASADNAAQQVALQYRVGTTGDFTNVPAGYIADATTANSDTQVTPVDVILPADAGNQAVVEIRIMTTNAFGSDEYVGIDNIAIANASQPPSATGNATPGAATAGSGVFLRATVTPGTVPSSTNLAVVCDTSSIGGSATQSLFDDASNGDVTAGDNTFSFSTTVAASVAAGAKLLACTVSDAESRTGTFTIAFEVLAECGNGALETGETCDDGNTTPGDGCSATCETEPGFECTATSPSSCTDIDECTTATDNCDVNAVCTNTPGSFTCACNEGFSGDGTACTDLDECTLGTDNCDANATCANTPGSFTCACNAGFEGNGTACTDIDECAEPGVCDMNATCTNVAGGFGCECNTGYTGDGITCTAVMTCGDGVIDSGEVCDDGNAANGDGCNAACAVEPEFVCTGTPSVCRGDRDGDGVANVDDNCPDVSNGNQTDADGNAIGDACESDGDGGCCSTSRDGGTGAWLLAFATLLGLRRRRR